MFLWTFWLFKKALYKSCISYLTLGTETNHIVGRIFHNTKKNTHNMKFTTLMSPSKLWHVFSLIKLQHWKVIKQPELQPDYLLLMASHQKSHKEREEHIRSYSLGKKRKVACKLHNAFSPSCIHFLQLLPRIL